MKGNFKVMVTLAISCCLMFTIVAVGVCEIGKGDSGEEVRAVQTRLAELGYEIGAIDGVFGVSTKNAVFLFQADSGIPGTGIVDDTTYNKLFGLGNNNSDDDLMSDSNNAEELLPITGGELATLKAELYILGYGDGETDEEVSESFLIEWNRFQREHGLDETDIIKRSDIEIVEELIASKVLFTTMQVDENGNIRNGLSNAEGVLVVPCQYSYIDDFECGIVRCGKDAGINEYYYYTGEKFVFPEGAYLNGGEFAYGLCPVRINGKWGYVNTAGKLSIPCQWDRADNFRNGYAAVEMNGQYAIIDPLGNQISEFESFHSAPSYAGEGWIYVSEADYSAHYYQIEGDAEIVTPNDYWDEFACGLLRISNSEDKWGYYNRDGELVIPFQFDAADEFYDGIAVVEVEGKWGYIDTNGKFVIAPVFDRANRFNNEAGYASVKQEGTDQYSLIDRNGNAVVEDVWSEKYVMFSEGYARIIQNGKIGFINLDGEIVIPPIWDMSEIETVDYFKRTNEYGGLYDSIVWALARGFTGGLALVSKDDNLYYINTEGEIIFTAGSARLGQPLKRESEKVVYTETQCKEIALNYLRNGLKNPESLQVHSTTSVFTDGQYIFTIDYSGMNGFGGYNREKYICAVDASKGTVTAAYSF